MSLKIRNSKLPGHILIVESLYDVMAKCSCGRWSLLKTGPGALPEVEDEWSKHATRAWKKLKKEASL